MLAVVVSIARAEGPLTALYTFGALVAYLFFIAIFIRPILALIARSPPHPRVSCVCVCARARVCVVLKLRSHLDSGGRRAGTR
jgi:hypothetical protein